jgi:prepilin-type N-terminal cleavage/methylation domain-containing protein
MVRRMKRGFTLAEVLVTTAVVAVVAAVVIPSVVRQITAGDPGRTSQDLQAVRTGIENFTLNLRPSYPGDIEDLINTPVAGTDKGIFGSSDDYTATQVTTWKGPYLEKTTSAATASAAVFTSGFGGSLLNGLEVCPFNNTGVAASTGTSCPGLISSASSAGTDAYATVRMTGLTSTQFEQINDLIDEGESPGSAAASSQNVGRARFNASATLFYFAYPYVSN